MVDQDKAQGHVHGHADHENCPKCWASLGTPLFCETCDQLLEAKGKPSPFASLGLPKAFPLDRMALRKRLLSYSRILHPDFHTTSGAEARALAERNTAELNAAFEILSDDFRRANWIVSSLGGPGDSQERQMPPAFLMEVLEWNEIIEEAQQAAPGSSEFDALPPLEAQLRKEREQLMKAISELLTPLPAMHAPELVEVRRRLNAVRYIDRTLEVIAELLMSRDTAQ